jgi:hypothetical protein
VEINSLVGFFAMAQEYRVAATHPYRSFGAIEVSASHR